MILPQKIHAKAPGKLIIAGEYAVLEGEPALVSAVDYEALVELTSSEHFSVSAPTLNLWQIPFDVRDSTSIIFPSDVEISVQKRLKFFKVTFEYTFHYFRNASLKSKHFHININTDAFFETEKHVKLGFGSSAAMTVALVRAIFLWANKEIDTANSRACIFRLALTAHRRAQNNLGSGVDIAASSYGGVLRYRVGINNRAEQEAPIPLKSWPDLPGLIIFTGQAESTRRMVSGVHELKKQNPLVYNNIITEMGLVAGGACEAYSNQDKNTFLPLIDQYHGLMLKLGEASGMPIISPVHQHLHEHVLKLGGVYKPSGAGSGDIGVAFAHDDDHLEHIRLATEDAGYLCFSFIKTNPIK